MAVTKKLYYEDALCMQFCATVLRCEPRDGRFAVVLDKTAFYPEGGGQPADHGALGGARVLDVREREGEIEHLVTAPLRVGEVVQGDVDRQRRIDHMQQHTGEHIVSGIVHAQYGWDNVGFHIGERDVTIDFSGPLGEKELADVERAANWVVWQNVPVTASWPSAEELARISYRSKKALQGPVRIVSVEGTDVCACCGTHVGRSGQVGLIKLTGVQSYKGGVRVTMLCGMRAFADYCVKQENARAVSERLSAKIDEIPAAVERLAQENIALKARAAALENRLFAARAAAQRGRGNALVFEDALSPDSLRRLCAALADVCPGVCAAFSPAGPQDAAQAACRWQYAVSGGRDTAALVRRMNEALNGRGGGKGILQGSVTAERAQIEAFFSSLPEE